MPESAALALPSATDFFEASTWVTFAPLAAIARLPTPV